ncbi:MAG: phage tail protein [bacterium]
MATGERLLQNLPEIFQSAIPELKPGEEAFGKRFLQIFEEQLDKLEKKVDRIPHIFDPWKADAKFLPWLASWLALELPEGEERVRRSLIANIHEIYRKRGTIKGLETILRIYLGEAVESLAEDTETPHRFIVTVNFPQFEPEKLVRQTRAIRQVIDAEKPAHTDYEWKIRTPTWQLDKYSILGKHTILGTMPNDDLDNSE